MTYVNPYRANNLLDLNFDAIAAALNAGGGAGFTGVKLVTAPHTLDLVADKGKVLFVGSATQGNTIVDLVGVDPTADPTFQCWIFNASAAMAFIDSNDFSGLQNVMPLSLTAIFASDPADNTGWIIAPTDHSQRGVVSTDATGDIGSTPLFVPQLDFSLACLKVYFATITADAATTATLTISWNDGTAKSLVLTLDTGDDTKFQQVSLPIIALSGTSVTYAISTGGSAAHYAYSIAVENLG